MGPDDPLTHCWDDHCPSELTRRPHDGMTVGLRVKNIPAQLVGIWTSWAIVLPGADWAEHDERAIWDEIDD